MRKPADKLLAEWFWTDRWMGSSAFLLPMEPRGLYREMLTQAWRRGARLPNDHEAIRRATGCTLEEWARCWPLIAGNWREDGTDLVNDTQLEIYATTVGLSEKRSAASLRGNAVRWGSQTPSQTPRQAVANTIAKPSPPSPSPSPEIKSKDSTGAWVYPRLVSSKMHPHIEQAAKDAAGKYADGLDYQPIYKQAADDYAAHGAPEDRLADLKKRVRIAALQRKDRITDPIPNAEQTRARLAEMEANAATPEQRAADVAKVREMFKGSR